MVLIAMPYVLAFCRVVIGLVFLISSLSKVRDIPQFQHTILSFRVLPQGLSGSSAILFLCSEALVFLCVCIGGELLIIGFSLAIFLLLIFCIALVSVLVRGISTSCHCFGGSDKQVSSFDIWRNIGFMLCALGGSILQIWIGRTQQSLSLSEWFLIGVVAAVAVLLWVEMREIIQLFSRSGVQMHQKTGGK